MAGITSSGIGSGLDVASLVQQLVSAEKTPAAQRINVREARASFKLSALGTFRSALAGLQGALESLKSGEVFGKLSATSSKTELFTASAGSTAVAGSYSVEVVALAQAHKLVSSPYASADTSLGNGDVQITVGTASFTVSLTDGSNSLAALRDAINGAADNSGVTATIVTESAGARLLLTSETTGASGSITVTSTLLSFTQKQAAQDAHVRVEGYDVYGSSNTVTGAVDGVTLNLVKAEPGTTASLTVAEDNSGAVQALQEFVKQYNNYVTTAADLTKYDPVKRHAAALTGDSLARQATQRLRDIVGNSVAGTGTFNFLSQIGIATKTDGTLTLDTAKLDEALASDRESVRQLFSSEGGYATRLDAAIEGLVETDGVIDERTDILNAQIKDYTKQREALDLRMAKVEARYLAQFTALDTLITQLRSTSDFLAQQLANLPQA